MKREYADAALAARAGGGPVALLTDTASGAQSILREDGVSGELKLDDAALAAARRAIVDDKSGTVDYGGGQLFVHVFNAPLRMIIVGAVHIAQALAPMAGIAGYAVTVVDPRGSFATEARFPGVALSADWPDEAMEKLAPDARTAVVTLSHDPKLDDPALTVALRSDAFYIGCLGSSRTHGKRLERLAALGFSEAETARLHGPVGLDIGALSPAEIALSIMAEITRARRRP